VRVQTRNNATKRMVQSACRKCRKESAGYRHW